MLRPLKLDVIGNIMCLTSHWQINKSIHTDNIFQWYQRKNALITNKLNIQQLKKIS
jgi:hypothetical protein